MSNRYLPGAEALLTRQVLALLEEAGQRGLAAGELQGSLPGEAGDVAAALARLVREGQAYEAKGRWLAAGADGRATGVVERLEKGDAVVRRIPPGQSSPEAEPGFYIARRFLLGAVDGDLVLVEPRPGRGRGRRSPRLVEAVVARVLSHRWETLVGTLETDDPGRRWLLPFDPKVPVELEVVGAGDVPDGQYVEAAIERVPGGREPRGRVLEVLGDPEVPGVDVRVVLRHYKIPDEFPPEVLAAAAAFPADPRPSDWAGREDLRRGTVITIDGASARDFDDAVSVERLPGGAFRLGVHIADVAHYVAEGGPLDAEAYRRGTSVYYPERAVPMLPEALSNGLCSLRPGVPRLTLSAFLDVDRQGQMVAHRFAETVIQSARRMTYAEVRRLLEEPRPGDRDEYGELLPLLGTLRELMTVLRAARDARGSIDFDLPEGNVELDTDGLMVGVIPGERNVAHRIIEELMIAANEAVASELANVQVPTLYRVHDQPSPERTADLRELLRTLGIPLKGSADTLHPGALQEVLRQVEGHPEEHFVASIVLRTMQRAVYSPECRGHYALASRYYTHFTSPIRRYPDLIVHRRLKELLHGRAHEEAERTRLAERLPEIAERASFTERRAEQSERDLLQWKKVRFFAGRVGERFSGRVTGVQPFGLFVQIEGAYVDGLVPVRTLGDDFFVYEPEAQRLVGERTRVAYKLADQVEVVITGADLRRRGLNFELAQPRQRGEQRPERTRRRREQRP